MRDRHADLADLAARQLVVGVVAGLRRQVEGDREARLPLREVAPVQLVRLLGGRMARIRPHHPRTVGLRQAVGGPGVVAHAPDCKVRIRGRSRKSVSARADRRPLPGARAGHRLLARRRRARRSGPGVVGREPARGARPDFRPRALLLTHIHLDHAGATGALVARWPDLEVYVHERGAPHVIDPSKLLASAGRLYGEESMRRAVGRGAAGAAGARARAERGRGARARRHGGASASPTRPATPRTTSPTCTRSRPRVRRRRRGRADPAAPT